MKVGELALKVLVSVGRSCPTPRLAPVVERQHPVVLRAAYSVSSVCYTDSHIAQLMIFST